MNRLKMGRRGFLASVAGLASYAAVPASVFRERSDHSNTRALLISSTTLAGHGSLEHARPYLAALYTGVRDLLLINFASLPQDRDAYEKRMQRDFRQVDDTLRVTSLHRIAKADAAHRIQTAEAVFVSGGNTFLLLRELYDRRAVDVLRARVASSMPYAGSSAGSNIAGTVIGTTNDFPLVDVPTRQSLGILPALYNPHHPDPEEDEAGFKSRQWKIAQYTSYDEDATVVGVTNPGMIRMEGGCIELAGKGGKAFVRRGDRERILRTNGDRDLAAAFAGLAAEEG